MVVAMVAGRVERTCHLLQLTTTLVKAPAKIYLIIWTQVSEICFAMAPAKIPEKILRT